MEWSPSENKEMKPPATDYCICVMCLAGMTCIAGRMLYSLTYQHFFPIIMRSAFYISYLTIFKSL